MKNKNSILVSVLTLMMLTIPTLARAADLPVKVFPLTQCPAIGDEYSNLIAKLDTIKSSIKEGANCNNVSLKVKSLEDLLIKDRARLMEIVELNHQGPLTSEQIDFVKGYAEEVTKKVTSLYDLFSGSNTCFRNDSPEAGLANLASFVSEASRLASSLSGPWGTPISLAGNVIAGFLTGMDQIMKTRVGYNFSDPADWKNFVQNLCTYHSFKDQIAHLLDPSGRLGQLRNLKQRLDQQIDRLAKSCAECEKIKQDFLTLGTANVDDIARADQRLSKPYGTFMSFSLGIRDWVIKEIDRVERESHSYWAQVSGRHLLANARTDLEQLLVVREAPRFLNYQTRRTGQDYGIFESFALLEGRNLYQALYSLNRDAVENTGYYFLNPMQMVKVLLIQPIRWNLIPDEKANDLRYSWAYFRDQGLTHFRNAEASLDVALGFCSFFRQAGYYNSNIRRACTSEALTNLVGKMTNLDRDLAAAGVQHTSLLRPLILDNEAAAPMSQLDSLNKLVEQISQP